MSNTVRRPRRRPRKGSCAWKTCGWLLRRVAVYAVYTDTPLAYDELAVRAWLCDLSARELASVFRHWVTRYRRGYHVATFRG